MLIIDGNSVYEIDEECLAKRKVSEECGVRQKLEEMKKETNVKRNKPGTDICRTTEKNE